MLPRLQIYIDNKKTYFRKELNNKLNLPSIVTDNAVAMMVRYNVDEVFILVRLLVLGPLTPLVLGPSSAQTALFYRNNPSFIWVVSVGYGITVVTRLAPVAMEDAICTAPFWTVSHPPGSARKVIGGRISILHPTNCKA